MNYTKGQTTVYSPIWQETKDEMLKVVGGTATSKDKADTFIATAIYLLMCAVEDLYARERKS